MRPQLQQEKMKTPSRVLISLLSACLLIAWASCNNPHDDFIDCFQSQNSISNSEVIYTPENTAYESILQSSIRNLLPASQHSSLKPKVIVTPNHESQIQAAIYCSKKHGLEIRVRSGGHDFEGLSYTSENPFVIVDLRNLRSISIDTQGKTAWIGAGATLGEVYHTIAETSRTLAFAAGTCPTIGVGGHISGGGFGMMSRKFGLAADNTIDAKIIDANGRILDRKTMGEDLFWAIRGGGGASFGVIIAWKVNLIEVPGIVTVFNVTRTEEQNATQLIHRWQYLADKLDGNLLIRLFISSVNSDITGERTIQVSFTSMFIGKTNDLLKIMQKNFPELGLTKEDCLETSWIESILFFAYIPLDESIDVLLNRTQDEVSYHKGKSDFVTHPISENGLTGLWKMLHEEDEGASQLQFTHYGGRMAEISESDIPFPHRAGIVYMIEYGLGWTEESESSRHINWMRRLHNYMAPYVSNSPRRAYLNYRDLDLGVNNINGDTSYRQASRWALRYFNNNFNRLVHVKTKVDPTNFFRNEQSIPPLSS